MNANFQLSIQTHHGLTDSDPTETREWVAALDSVICEVGPERALYLLDELDEQMRRRGVRSSNRPFSAYRNTISVDKQGPYPGDLALEERLTSVIRWNA